ncbi:hypothetical protein GH733_002105 [Mirounga leonina]|nr:hypothetical protein GH733_002105 [Mirounga leonina]
MRSKRGGGLPRGGGYRHQEATEPPGAVTQSPACLALGWAARAKRLWLQRPGPRHRASQPSLRYLPEPSRQLAQVRHWRERKGLGRADSPWERAVRPSPGPARLPPPPEGPGPHSSSGDLGTRGLRELKGVHAGGRGLERGGQCGSPRAGPPGLDPVRRAGTGHALSLSQQSTLSSCLSGPPAPQRSWAGQIKS